MDTFLIMFLIGLLAGFVAGGWVIYYDHKGRVSRGQTPYIDYDGRMEWR